MLLLDEANADEYLRARGWVNAEEEVRVRLLAGGVSNQVLFVERTGGEDFVLKQARERLRVPQEWLSRVDRIWREMDVLRVCQDVLARHPVEWGGRSAATPQVLREDRENYAFTMQAAPAHEVWKRQLLEGRADGDIARACGLLLGTLHAGTWGDDSVAKLLADRAIFDELRVDPYYRRVAEVHPELAGAIGELIASLDENLVCLVHADFSPKNLLVYDGGLMMVDFETGHFGDPGFDLGFFLTHLALKSVYHGEDGARFVRLAKCFWEGYEPAMRQVVEEPTYAALLRRGRMNFGGCLLARVDGKSPVEYLNEAQRERARAMGIETLVDGDSHGFFPGGGQ